MFHRNAPGNTPVKAEPTSNVPVRSTENGERATDLIFRTPREEMAQITQWMEDLSARLFGFTPLSRLIGTEGNELIEFEPAMDLYQTNDAVHLSAALPGYTPEQIKIEASENRFTIQGERPPLRQGGKQDGQAVGYRNGGVTSASRFQISASLPVEIDPQKIKATLSNGILTVDMPKSEQARSRTVNVAVQPA